MFFSCTPVDHLVHPLGHTHPALGPPLQCINCIGTRGHLHSMT